MIDIILITKSALMFLFLHFCTKSYLIRKLRRLIEWNGFHFVSEPSGRVALYRVARFCHRKNERNVAWVPDYICNVVNASLERAGFEVRSYQTDDLFEPRIPEIKEALSDNATTLFLTASIFGSTAFLNGLKEKEIKQLVFERNIHVIVDLCQDIGLIKEVPSDYGNNLSAVLSFNDKSFLGVMGGGILTALDIATSSEKVTFKQVRLLYKTFLYKVLLCLMKQFRISNEAMATCEKEESAITSVRMNGRKSGHPEFDYSYCQQYPYAFDTVEIAKIQVIMAIIGLSTMDLINAKKKRFAIACPNVLRTKYYLTSPYLVVTGPAEGCLHRKMKRSYALHQSPGVSLREGLRIIHNKGFCDEG